MDWCALTQRMVAACILIAMQAPASHAAGATGAGPYCVKRFVDRALGPRVRVLGNSPLLRHPGKETAQGALLDLAALRRVTISIDLAKGPFDALASLPPGNYIYLMNKSELKVIPRVLAGKTGKPYSPRGFLGTHDGLRRMMDPSPITAAGEFVIRDGRVAAITNQSGSYRGRSAHLRYAEQQLRRAGLKADESTKVLDVSRKEGADAHVAAFEDALLQMRLRGNPLSRKAHADTQRVMARAVPIEDELADWLEDRLFFAKKHPTGTDPDDYGFAIQLLSKWLNPMDSEAWIVHQFVETALENDWDRYSRIVKLLDQEAKALLKSKARPGAGK